MQMVIPVAHLGSDVVRFAMGEKNRCLCRIRCLLGVLGDARRTWRDEEDDDAAF